MLNSINNRMMWQALEKADKAKQKREDAIAVLTIIGLALLFAVLATI